jgi:elongation factor P
MAAIKYMDLRKGMFYIGEDGQLYQCLDRELITPGNWRAILNLKIRNLKTGSIVVVRFKPEDKVEQAFLDTRDMQFSYREGDDVYFMDSETFEQMAIPADFIEEQLGFIKENDIVQVTVFEGKALSVELPQVVELKVVETDPGIKGATAAAQYKPATLETGAKVNVPPFINVGETIKVDTRTKEYLSRAAK